MGDYRRWSSGSGLGGRLRSMILIHRGSNEKSNCCLKKRAYTEFKEKL